MWCAGSKLDSRYSCYTDSRSTYKLISRTRLIYVPVAFASLRATPCTSRRRRAASATATTPEEGPRSFPPWRTPSAPRRRRAWSRRRGRRPRRAAYSTQPSDSLRSSCAGRSIETILRTHEMKYRILKFCVSPSSAVRRSNSTKRGRAARHSPQYFCVFFVVSRLRLRRHTQDVKAGSLEATTINYVRLRRREGKHGRRSMAQNEAAKMLTARCLWACSSMAIKVSQLPNSHSSVRTKYLDNE